MKGSLLTESGLGKIGWFPANYVEPLIEEPANHPISIKSSSASSVPDGERGFWRQRTNSSSPAQSTAILNAAKSSKFRKRRASETKLQHSHVDIKVAAASPIKTDFNASSAPTKDAVEASSPSLKSFHSDVGKRIEIISHHGSDAAFPVNPPVELDVTMWKSRLSSAEVGMMNEKDQRRLNAIWEVYLTETAFVQDISMLCEVTTDGLIVDVVDAGAASS